MGIKLHLKNNAFSIILLILAGFTFGLPIGAKITSKLLQEEKITLQQAQILVNHCNVIGPAFISGYYLHQHFHANQLIYPTIGILYLPQILHFLILWIFQKNTSIHKQETKKTNSSSTIKETSRLNDSYQILDVAIMNGFETITLLGGYLILFGIICLYINQISNLPIVAKDIIILGCEITTGIHQISQSNISFSMKYLLCNAFCTFGGLCSTLQTNAIIKNTSLSIRSYVIHKCIFAIISIILTYMYLFFIKK